MRRIPALALLASLALAGCSQSKLVHGCSRDEDCGDPAIYRCELETAQCRCKTNAACNVGEYCNPQGYCQAHVGCYETRDCPQGFFCDPRANVCLADGRCASDLDCPAGQLCDPASKTCKSGCRVDGDCPLRAVCLCAAPGDGGASEELCSCGQGDGGTAGCSIGHCASGLCRDDGFCAFGEVCRTPPEGGLAVCQSDYDPDLRPYCANCVSLPGQPACGKGPNFCLTSVLEQDTYFCGVDCSAGQACANGYDCNDVIVVWTRTECLLQDDCMSPSRRTSIPCQIDSDCPNHGLCGHDPGTLVGFCFGRCVLDEGARQSYCACVADDDCAQDTCVAETRECSISRKRCDPNGAGCGKINCVDYGDQGGCRIGQNCAPLEGLTCADVRTSP